MSKIEKQQCEKCLGVGLIKTDVKICQICDGIKCMSCNSTGLEVMPYSECSECDGLGTVQRIIHITEPEIKTNFIHHANNNAK